MLRLDLLIYCCFEWTLDNDYNVISFKTLTLLLLVLQYFIYYR